MVTVKDVGKFVLLTFEDCVAMPDGNVYFAVAGEVKQVDTKNIVIENLKIKKSNVVAVLETSSVKVSSGTFTFTETGRREETDPVIYNLTFHLKSPTKPTLTTIK